MGGLHIAISLAVLTAGGPGPSPNPKELTVDEAVALAVESSPRLAAQRAQVDIARAELERGRTYPFNPVVRGTVGSRRGPDETSTDYSASVAQELEIFGQRGRRIEATTAELQRARAVFRRDRQVLVARVTLAFTGALRAREMLETARAEHELAQALVDIATRRLQAGAGTQLDENLATVEMGRAEARLAGARAEYVESRAVLAESVGLSPSSLPEPQGDLHELPSEPLPDTAELIEQLGASRPDLLALDRALEAVRARLSLARAEAVPNLVVGGFFEQEEGTDRIVGGSLALPIPVFNRNQGGIAAAQADLTRFRAMREAASLEALRELVVAAARYEAAAASLAALRRRVLGTFEESLVLLRRAFDAGKIGIADVLTSRRSLVDARRDLIEIAAAARRYRVALELAAGTIQTSVQSSR